MDWSNELYVRLYRRETDDDLLLSWEARAVWHEMLKKFDRSGIIQTRRGALGLAALVRIPAPVVERALLELVEDGRIRQIDTGYFAPNFMAAQETGKSDRLRQKEFRERRREQASSRSSHDSLRARDAPLRDVTPSNDESRDVTDRHSELILADLNRSELSARVRARSFSAEYERRRIPEDPGVFMVLEPSGNLLGLVRILEDGSEEIVEDRR
jgi:hypothetical protein